MGGKSGDYRQSGIRSCDLQIEEGPGIEDEVCSKEGNRKGAFEMGAYKRSWVRVRPAQQAKAFRLLVRRGSAERMVGFPLFPS